MTIRKSLNIFFSVDENYIIHFTVALTSLLENNKNIDVYVYVIYDEKFRGKMNQVESFFNRKYDVKLNLLPINDNIFSNVPISHYISKASYYRLLLADLIPDIVDHGLYLDCDTIVTGSLSELANPVSLPSIQKEDYYFIAVPDKGEETDIIRFKKIGIQLNGYFNAGVMFINLKKWRIDNVSIKLLQTMREYEPHLKWHDQDVLNIFFKNKWGKLNDTYNKFVDKKLSELPKIIHFSGSSKPWHYLNYHPYKSHYWKYLNLTPFKDEKFDNVTIKKVIQKYRYKLVRSARKISRKAENNY